VRAGLVTQFASAQRRVVKLFLVPREASMSETMVPDHLVTEPTVDPFLEIEPPPIRATAEFNTIIEEIERTYVLGAFFSALSASVVTTERMLNKARIGLHKLVTHKIKMLWEKAAITDWQPNINALAKWKYLSADFVEELSALYKIRCHYLHLGDIANVKADSLRSIKATYRLLNELIGFPPRLFKVGSVVECLDAGDPLVDIFYRPCVVQS
jgi:hypothetical protein